MAARRLAAAVWLLFAAAVGSADESVPEIRAIEIDGASFYSRPAILKLIRLDPGDRLRREPEAIAAGLERSYQAEGFPAASVSGSFDAPSGTLRLVVDEGKLAELEVVGLSGAAGERARAATELKLGGVLRASEVLDALARLEEASDGALAAGEYRVEPGADGARLVLEPRRPWGRVEPRFGGLRAAGRRNRVDGFTQPLGVEATAFDASSFNHATAYAIAAYGFSSHDFRHAVGIGRSFFAGGRLALGYEHHDLTDTDDLFRSVGLEEAKGTALYTSSHSDYFRRRGHEAYAFGRLAPWAQLGLSFRSDDYMSLPVTTSADEPNPPIDPGLARSLIATLRLSAGEPLFTSPRSERHSYLHRSLYGLYRTVPRLRGEATYEIAAKALGGDFEFRRFIANLRAHQALTPSHALDARLLVGVTSGEPPAQKRFALGGTGTLRGYALKAFPGENIALLTLECGFAARDWLPKLILFYDGGSAWTSGLRGEGWKSDLGAGLRFPADSGIFARLDFARALGDADETRVRTIFRFQIPF